MKINKLRENKLFNNKVFFIFKKHRLLILINLFLLAILASLIIESLQIQKIKNQRIMTVSFLNVGQADALLITTPNQRRIMVDTGLDEAVVNRLSKKLSHFDKTIDLIISTHGHADHVGGLPKIIEQYKLKNHVSNFLDDKILLVKRIEKQITEQKINQITLQAGDRVILDKKNNIYINILWPTELVPINDKNDNSIVIHLVFDDVKFLMTGDASSKIENYLISEFSEKIDSYVLKLGHHGSKTSTSINFLKEVNPKYIIISAGKNNKYGHPHQEVLDNLEKYKKQAINFCEEDNNKNCHNYFSPKWIRSTSEGSVVFQTNGQEIWLK